MAKRHSIDTIAEVLIDKLSDMEKVADKIDKASKKPLSVDLSQTKALLEEFAGFIEKETEQKQTNQARLPNWVIGVLFGFFLASLGTLYFSYTSIKKVDALELERDYYIMKYRELQEKE